MKKFIFLSLAIFSTSLFAHTLTYEEKMEDLSQIAALIKSQYGPYEFKKSTHQIDPDTLLGKYSLLVKPLSNLQYYYLLNQYIAEFKDSHFSGQVQTNHISYLGFTADLVQGKVLLDEVDRKVLPEATFPFQKGDEIVTFDSRPVHEVISELEKYRGMGNPASRHRLFTFFVGWRPSALVPPQSGKVTVGIRKLNQTPTQWVELEWKQTGEEIPQETNGTNSLAKMDYGDLSIQDLYAPLGPAEQKFRCSGITRIAIPKDAVMLMTTPFVAYYHATPKGNVGYIRIPHYNWINEATGANENELRFHQYEWVVDQMEKNTVGVIIDQDHNCGGDVDLVEKTVSLFAKEPFKGLEFQFLATRSEYLELKGWVKDQDKSTVQGAELMKVVELIKSTWLAGITRMTTKTTFHFDRKVQPDAIHYTKPVIVLTDEMSGSGGDAFPALMQGNGLAKIMGNRTMGADGHVEEFPALNYSGNKVRMTKSLFFHPNGTPIENNGVTPDPGYLYLPTVNDFTNQYSEYQKAYEEKLLALVP